jgi:hypothetical protein
MPVFTIPRSRPGGGGGAPQRAPASPAPQRTAAPLRRGASPLTSAPPLTVVDAAERLRTTTLTIDLPRPCNPLLDNAGLFAAAGVLRAPDPHLALRQLLAVRIGQELHRQMGIAPGSTAAAQLLRFDLPAYVATATSCGYTMQGVVHSGDQVQKLNFTFAPRDDTVQSQLAPLQFTGFDGYPLQARLTMSSGSFSRHHVRAIGMPETLTQGGLIKVLTAALQHKLASTAVSVLSAHSMYLDPTIPGAGFKTGCYDVVILSPQPPVGVLELHWRAGFGEACTAQVRLDHAVSARSPVPPDAHLATRTASGVPMPAPPALPAARLPPRGASHPFPTTSPSPAMPAAPPPAPTASTQQPQCMHPVPAQQQQQQQQEHRREQQQQQQQHGHAAPVGASSSSTTLVALAPCTAVAMAAAAGPIVGFKRPPPPSSSSSEASSSGVVAGLGPFGVVDASVSAALRAFVPDRSWAGVAAAAAAAVPDLDG